jgi:hypothetical protein
LKLLHPGLARRRRLSLLIPAVIGFLFFALAVAGAVPNIRFIATAKRTQGHFIGAVTKIGGNHGGSFYRPMFRYQAADGSIRSFTARSGSSDQPYADGQAVTVLYDPAHPEDARLNGFYELWIGPVVLGVTGLFLIALGISLFGAIRRRDAGR